MKLKKVVKLFGDTAGSETFFRLRAAGYRGDLGKRSMGSEPEPYIKEKDPGN